MVGDRAFEIALAWMVIESTGSIGALSLVLLCQAVPRGLLLLLGGAVVDRYSPRTVMIVAHLVRAVALGLLAGAAASGSIPLWQLCAVAAVMGTAAAFFTPAGESILPTLVERPDLGRANAIQGVLEQLSYIVGPILGGVLVAAAGESTVFALNGLTFLIAAGTAAVAPRARAVRESPSAAMMFGQIRDGLSHAWSSREIRLVLIIVSAATLSYSGVFAVGLPALAASLGDATSLGLMVSGWGAGQLVGAVAASVTGLPRRWGLLIIGMTLVEGLMFMALGVVPSAWAAAGLLFLVGIGVSYSSDVALPTFVQTQTPPELLGRVSSVIGLPRVVFEPVSIALLGLVLSQSVPWGFAVAALPVLLAGIVLARDPRARQLSTQTALDGANS